MDSFYLIVLAVASICLIVSLAFMGWMISKQKGTDKYPSFITSCPDFWSVSKDSNNNIVCTQPTTFNSGIPLNASNPLNDNNTPGVKFNSTGNTVSFGDARWSANGDATCAKKEWAQKHNIRWDSVESANFC